MTNLSIKCSFYAWLNNLNNLLDYVMTNDTGFTIFLFKLFIL